MFVPLNTFSSFSLLEGVPAPTELAARAAMAGLPAIALTDRGNLIGALEFNQACLAAGVQPIFGLTLRVASPARSGLGAGSLVLLAQNRAGWRSLCRLSSLLNSEPEYIANGSVPFSILIRETDGLLCLTGGQDSLIFRPSTPNFSRTALQLLDRLRQAFPERLYIQISDPEDELRSRRAAARTLDLPIVYAPAMYYLATEDQHFQRLLTAIRHNQHVRALPASAAAPPGSDFLDAAAALQRCSSLPSGLAQKIIQQTVEIAGRCKFELPTNRLRFPEISPPTGLSPAEYLRDRAFQGARQLYGTISPAIQSRLDHELAVIHRSGFDSLFLIMDEIIQFARQADIPTASRGSASSSLVAHCLGITTPDPLRLNLYFERFLNPARSKPPDIDTDVCSVRRDELIEHIYQHYGRDRVAMVATINRFRRRSALRETAKAYGLEQVHINQLVRDLPSRGWGPPRFTAALESDPYEELANNNRQPPVPEVLHLARRLINHPNHLSIHPGGVVIAPHHLTDLVPTLLSSKGILITQFDLEGVEAFGLVKIDILGIRGLTVLGDVADGLIAARPGPTNTRLQVLASIPEQDPATAKLVSEGRTIGCFQIESPGMRATLQETQARSIDDIMAALALFRPGPMTGGLKDAFIRRHLGQEQIEHLHPALAELLQDTYGVILYQEQVLRIAHELAGLSLADADLLRRAMSHFDPGEQMVTLQQKFIDGAHQKSNIPPEIGDRIWDLMAAFAGYGFPKAHAASYAEIAWRSAWFKTHFPAEFMAAVLANWGGYYSQRVYLSEARRLGLPVQAPDIRFSQREFCAHQVAGEKILFMGLNQVRDLTRRTQAKILHERPYASLENFLLRVDPRPREAQNLVKAGALNCFGHEAFLLQRLKELGQSGNQLRQLSLFSLAESAASDEPWTIQQRAAAQEAVLGLSVDHHPLELVQAELEATGVISTAAVASHLGQKIRLAGIRQSWRRRRRLGNTSYYELIFEDREGQCIVLLAPSLYRRSRQLLQQPVVLVVAGEIIAPDEVDEPLLLARQVWPVSSTVNGSGG